MRRFKKIPFIVVLVSTLIASVSIHFTIIKFRDIPFPWDSAAHAFEGLKIAQDLERRDMVSFFADTYRQGWWPFFHSWLLAPAFILFGKSYAVARDVSLFCFFLFVLVLYLTGVEISEHRGHWAGLLNVYLALTSLPFLVLSSTSMAEVPGAFMTALTFLFYLKAIKRHRPYLYVITSLLMSLTFFTKWHLGLFAIFAIFLTQITHEKKWFSTGNYGLFLPFAALMTVWFIHPQHLISFFEHATFQPHFYKFFSAGNWLFYPKSFFRIYHFSILLPLIITPCFFYSLKNIKAPEIRLFAFHFFIGIIFLIIKLDNRHRYLISIVPSVWILGTAQLVELVHSMKTRFPDNKKKIVFLWLAAFPVLIIAILSVPRVYRKYPNSLISYNYWSDEKPNKAYRFIAQQVARHDHIAVFGSWDYYNSLKSPTLRWHIELRRNADDAGRKATKEKADFFFRNLLKNRDKKSYLQFIRFIDNKNVRVSEYHLLSFIKTLDKERYQEIRKTTPINPFSDKIVDMRTMDRNITCLITISRKAEKELNRFMESFFSNHAEWDLFMVKKFFDLGITIRFYERKKSQLLSSHTDRRAAIPMDHRLC